MLSKAIVYLGFTFCLVHPMDFEKCTMTCNYNYDITKNIFTALKATCTPTYSSFSPSSYHLATNDFSSCICSFAFSRMAYSWNYIVCSLLNWLLSLCNGYVSFFLLCVCGLRSPFFLLLSSILLNGYTIVCLSIHLLKEILIIFRFTWLQIRLLLIKIFCANLCGCKFSAHFSKYQGANLLDHMVSKCLLL